MGIVNVFKELDDYKREIHTFNGKIKSNLDLDWTRCKIFLGGKELKPCYKVKEDDVIFIQEYPGVVTSTMLAIGIIAVGVLTVGVGIGTALYARHLAREAERKMNDALRRMNNNNRRRDVESIPHLSGGRNEFAEGKQGPIILGRHLFTPYFLSEPYLEIDGTDGVDLYWYGTFLVGQTGINIERIRNGMIDLVTLTGDTQTPPGKEYFDRPAAFDPDNPPPFHEPGNFVEICQQGYFSNSVFNERWEDSLEANAEIGRLRSDEAGTYRDIYVEDDGPDPVIRETARFPMRIEVEILVDGLHGWDSNNGVPTNATVALRLEWSRDGEAGWTALPGWGDMTLTRNSMRQMRFMAAEDLPASVYSDDGKPVYIRATRLTRQHVGGFRSRTILTAIRTKQYSPRESTDSRLVAAKNIAPSLAEKFCRIGLKIKVNQNTQDALDRFNVIASMTGRVWDGKNWSLEKYATSNPASVALEVLTGLIHEPSRHEMSEINLDSLGRLYQWCDSREVNVEGSIRPLKLSACGVLTSPVRKLDVLQSVLGTADAGLYVSEYGRLTFWYDDFQTTPVGLLNPQRLVSMNETRNLGRRADGYAVQFIDRDGDWAERTERVLRPRVKRILGKNSYDDFRPEYVTDHYHAMWLARRTMAREILQPGEIEVEVGREGRYFKPGSLIKAQHEGFRIGIGSGEVSRRIVENGVTVGIKTMEKYEIRSDRDYWVDMYIVDSGRNHVVTRQIRSTGGYTNELYFTVPLNDHDKPALGNIVSVVNRESKRCVVMDSSPTKKGYRLKLVKYDDEIYQTSAIDAISAYKSGILPRPPKHYQTPPREVWIPPPAPPNVGDNGNIWQGGVDTGIPAFAPRYRGVTEVADLQNTGVINGERMNMGDWVLFTGETVGIWQSNRLMEWDGSTWSFLPIERNHGKYLLAVSDITRNSPDGIFNTAFIGQLFADMVHVQVLNVLCTLQSSNFSNTEGWQFGSNGLAILNGARVRGHIVAEDGSFRGHVEAESGSFQNVHIGDRAIFEGSVLSGPLVATNDPSTPSPGQIWTNGTRITQIRVDLGISGTDTRILNVAGGMVGARQGITRLEFYTEPSNAFNVPRIDGLRVFFSTGNPVLFFPNTITQRLEIGGATAGRTLRFIELPTGGIGLPAGTVYRIQHPTQTNLTILGIV
ncbi:MAG: DUF3672 domain-containing protein [Treponema sp.]|nr:DUF3672 domain-containing protein [Treponema sp.]